MENNVLQHWGIKGMKWGVRRFRKKDGSLTPAGKKRYNDSEPENEVHADYKKARSKKVKAMSDQELRQAINRLQMEKQYKELKATDVSSGKAFIKRLGKKSLGVGGSSLEGGAKNIGTQLATYGMGTAVNRLAGVDIVNPKKGQKDKK